MKRVDLPMAFFRVSNVISSAGVLCRPEQESMLNIFVQGTFEGTGYKVVKSFFSPLPSLGYFGTQPPPEVRWSHRCSFSWTDGPHLEAECRKFSFFNNFFHHMFICLCKPPESCCPYSAQC